MLSTFGELVLAEKLQQISCLYNIVLFFCFVCCDHYARIKDFIIGLVFINLQVLNFRYQTLILVKSS